MTARTGPWDDEGAPYALRPTERTPYEQTLMEAASRDVADRADWVNARRLHALIPDTNPDMPHAPGGLDPAIRAAVERITGKPLLSREHVAPNPAGARASLKRWAWRWRIYLAS